MPYTPGQFKWRVILMYTIAIMAALVTFFLTYRYLSDKKLQYRAKLDEMSRQEAKYIVEFISPVTFEVVKSFELMKSEMMASKNSVTVIYADGEILVWTGPYRIRHP